MKKRFPNLKTEKDVHQFWSRHSFTDHLDDVEEIDEKIQLDPALAYKIREPHQEKTDCFTVGTVAA